MGSNGLKLRSFLLTKKALGHEISPLKHVYLKDEINQTAFGEFWYLHIIARKLLQPLYRTHFYLTLTQQPTLKITLPDLCSRILFPKKQYNDKLTQTS